MLDIVHTVMHQVRSLQYRVLRDGPHDITHMDSRVLGYFGRHPGATQSELAAFSGRDKAQLARLVKGLRDRGLLQATADQADRRNVHLHLTAEGEAVQAALRQQAQRLGEKAVAGFSDEDRARLAGLLRRVQANLDAADPAP
ncbi:MarR family winged helix-turn-helix transcriptional regulator [Xylophilus sp. GOD-11R]|uniref:MarR family winged helix-turn-helix transcriptional regulator n=1 Tax=Xylophilus sp. GOD-11R TaxID=3089814 RepID=UPI00298D2ED7|nr:MarR family transcriptional regulator [Xylophilus sp. GOD-11R]WPB56402.1 MarR family transcriptional regulator [Xylophilus sp. GOD-11R]